MDNNKYFIGIDIGGTKITIALIDEKGEIFYKENLKTKENLDKFVALKNIINTCKKIKNNFSDKNILGVGIGACGIILYEKGMIKFSPNIGWKDFEIVREMEKVLGLKIILDNDANAAAWGEFFLNYKDKFKNVICITLGTGVGGGIILNKKLYRGTDGTAGEIGHITYIHDGKSCPCGNNGCIERYIGTKGIIEFAEDLLLKVKNQETPMHKEFSESILFEIQRKEKILMPKFIQDAGFSGDKLALFIWEEFGKILGVLISSIINIFNPSAIHITGGISHAEKLFIESLKKEVKKRAFALPRETAKIIFSEERQDMGVIGAGLLLMES